MEISWHYGCCQNNPKELRILFLGRAAAGDPLNANMLEFEGQLVAAGLVGPVALHRVRAEARATD